MPKLEKASPCPHCGSINDGATATRGETVLPRPGDIAICIYCTEFAVYDEQLELVKMPDEQMKEIQEKYPEVYAEIFRVKEAAFRAKFGRPGKN